MIKFVQASEENKDIIVNLYLKKYKELEEKNIRMWNLEDISWNALTRIYKPEEFYFVYRDDEIVGSFCICTKDEEHWPDDKDKALYIHKVMVLNTASKTGVSDQILTFFKNYTKEHGYEVCKLDVRDYKDKLIEYYERNDFKLVKKIDLNKGYLVRLYEYRV